MTNISKNLLILQYRKNLKNQTRYGMSKHKNKIQHKEEYKKTNTSYQQPKGIYSTSTYTSYDETCRSFVIWILKNHSQKIKNYMNCKKFAAEWLKEKELSGLSAWTLNMYGSALACSFNGISKSELGYTFPKRERKNVKRNRDNNLNNYTKKAQRDAMEMFKATGCRRTELLKLRKEDFRKQINAQGQETGCMEVYKRGK